MLHWDTLNCSGSLLQAVDSVNLRLGIGDTHICFIYLEFVIHLYTHIFYIYTGVQN